jgi:hypothetical protein
MVVSTDCFDLLVHGRDVEELDGLIPDRFHEERWFVRVHRRLRRDHRMLEPRLEAGRSELGTVARHQRALVQLHAEVGGVGVGDHRTRVVAGAEGLTDQLVETELFRSGDLDDANSTISKRIAMEKVSVRKAEKGTKPKLFYAGVDGDLLNPSMMEPQATHFWADKDPGEDLYALKMQSGELKAVKPSS